MAGVTESEVIRFFHASRAAAKRARSGPAPGADRLRAAVEQRVGEVWRDWRWACEADAKAARDAYERGLE